MKPNRRAPLLILLAAASAYQQKAPYLRSVEILPYDRENPIEKKVLNVSSRPSVTAELELGESIENQIILLHPQAAAGREFMVEQRHETILTVMNEGPHLDLVHWKHHVSEWRELKRVDKNRFLTLSIDEREKAKFPAVSGQEIRQAVLKAGGPEWAKLVRNVKGPNDSPVAVGVSRVSFRIKVKEGAQWRVIRTLHFTVPMGC